MIKEITVAGIKLNNYTVLENLTQINKNINEKIFTAVEEVYMNTLLLAQEDELVKKALELADITVIAELGILDAVGEATVIHKHEIEHREFFFQLMKILERGNFKVYILGDDEKEVELAVNYVSEEFPRLQIIGAELLRNHAEDVINEINLAAPDVILSVLSTPLQEEFFAENRSMLSTKIWYGMGSGKIAGQKHSLRYMLVKKIREHRLMRYIKGYKEE